MPRSELLEDFELIREYMREFYVNGFKSRDEFTMKSARSYDDERRRIENWLDGYMCFRNTSNGKNQFISIDSRLTCHNPLYRAWKTKTFTDNDITFHFLLFDILDSPSPDKQFSIGDIQREFDSRLEKHYDYKTVQNKVKKYVEEGLIEEIPNDKGRRVVYRRSIDCVFPDTEVLSFFSEVAPCGVIGSFLLDKTDNNKDCFAFKHHYISSSMDSGVMCSILKAMHSHSMVSVTLINRSKQTITYHEVIPLRVYISVQNGRQYLMAYSPKNRKMESFRIDSITYVMILEKSERFDEFRKKLDDIQCHMWGVSSRISCRSKMQHVEFTVQVADDEQHIVNRLMREKRVGTVEQTGPNEYRFLADVFDSSELIPWIRTFIGRITSIRFFNPNVQEHFMAELVEMYDMYGI